jgi:hypothetical protein
MPDETLATELKALAEKEAAGAPPAPSTRAKRPHAELLRLTRGGAPMGRGRDTFRSRKPNTSRPPSVHVDDFMKATLLAPSSARASKPAEVRKAEPRDKAAQKRETRSRSWDEEAYFARHERGTRHDPRERWHAGIKFYSRLQKYHDLFWCSFCLSYVSLPLILTDSACLDRSDEGRYSQLSREGYFSERRGLSGRHPEYSFTSGRSSERSSYPTTYSHERGT